MNIEDLAQLLLSQQAVLIYEIIIFVIMVFFSLTTDPETTNDHGLAL